MQVEAGLSRFLIVRVPARVRQLHHDCGLRSCRILFALLLLPLGLLGLLVGRGGCAIGGAGDVSGHRWVDAVPPRHPPGEEWGGRATVAAALAARIDEAPRVNRPGLRKVMR